MNFRVGMKVVCVDASGWGEADYSSWNYPRENDTATVDSIYDYCGILCVTLLEFPNDHPTKPGFRASRFRPAVSPKSQISFTQDAPLDSEQWDNRRRLPAHVKEIGASA